MGFGQPTVTALVAQIEANSGDLNTLDVSNNASFRMRPSESMAAFAAALRSDTTVKMLILRECELADPDAEVIADLLTDNHCIEELDLQRNQLTSAGAISIARGLVKNRGLRTLNLMNQKVKAFSEECAEKYKEAFETNITLTKIMWNLTSRQAWTVSQLITRNNEIWRRVASNRNYQSLLPERVTSLANDLTTADWPPTLRRESSRSSMGMANGLQRIPSDISLRCSTGGPNDDSCRSQVRRTVSERQLGSGAGSFGALLQKFQDHPRSARSHSLPDDSLVSSPCKDNAKLATSVVEEEEEAFVPHEEASTQGPQESDASTTFSVEIEACLSTGELVTTLSTTPSATGAEVRAMLKEHVQHPRSCVWKLLNSDGEILGDDQIVSESCETLRVQVVLGAWLTPGCYRGKHVETAASPAKATVCTQYVLGIDPRGGFAISRVVKGGRLRQMSCARGRIIPTGKDTLDLHFDQEEREVMSLVVTESKRVSLNALCQHLDGSISMQAVLIAG